MVASDWRGPLGLTLRDLSRMMAGWNWGNKIGGGHITIGTGGGGNGTGEHAAVATVEGGSMGGGKGRSDLVPRVGRQRM